MESLWVRGSREMPVVTTRNCFLQLPKSEKDGASGPILDI